MSGEKKAIELQMQVRQNAHEYQNSVKELYTWEKEIKSKEEALKKAPAPAVNTNTAPVRSHVPAKKSTTGKKVEECAATGSNVRSAASTPTEKQDLPQDALAQQHKRANDVKDRGNSYVKQADYEKAIEAYSEAIEIYPYDPIYFINRALCHLKLESFVNCVDDCEAAIALDKLCVKAYYRRMQANESLGNNMEALKDCTTVLTLDPKNIEGKSSLARINERLRKIATKHGPNFNPPRDDLIDIFPFDKPAYKRSNQSMRRVPVVDIISPRPSQLENPSISRISDDDIDKIFNSNCGPFEEIKKENLPKTGLKTKQAIAQQSKITDITSTKSLETTVKAAPKENSKTEITAKKTVENTATKPTEKQVKEQDSAKNLKTEDNAKQTVEKTATKVTEKLVKEQNAAKNLKTEDSAKKTVEKTITKVPEKLEKEQVSVKSTPSEPEIVETEKTNKETEAQTKPTTTTSMERVPAAPAGTAQFYITWKELSPNQKYHYLKSIEIANLCKILGAGFDSDTFTDLLRTLQDFYVPNKEPTTAAVLLEIAKNDEFTILAMLMSQQEKQMVSNIMKAIKELPKSNPSLLEKLGKAYNSI